MSIISSSNLNSKSSAFAVLCNNSGKHYIFENKVFIGRNPSAFLCITHSCISRRHCFIEKTEDNKFTICDMSNSGTFVNDERLVKGIAQEIKHMDRIGIGGLSAYTYAFVINKKIFSKQTPSNVDTDSLLAKRMNHLNETQYLEVESMDKEMSMVESEVMRLKEELQQQMVAQEDELKRERLKANLQSDQNKEQAENLKKRLNEILEEKEKVMKFYELKISENAKKEEELLKSKNEMIKRHQIEREELENRCKAEIEELKKKLEISETQNQQCKKLQNQLEDIKNALLESELEMQRLFEAKVEIETKFEAKIIDLTNLGERKEEDFKELKTKMLEQEKIVEKVKKELEGLEEDILCSICAEIFIEPTVVLNCGHLFCKQCITQWTKKSKICPMCREKVVNTVKIYNMDTMIQRAVRLMPEEAQSRREVLIAQRKTGKTPKKKRACRKRRCEVNQPPHPASVARLSTIESEGVDPFQSGWVIHPQMQRAEVAERNSPVTIAAVDLTNLSQMRSTRVIGRNSPVTIAAVDLTNTPERLVPAPVRLRTHTVTSAEANSTIDLTDL